MVDQLIQKKLEKKRIEEEQAATAQNWKLPVCYDDDDDEEESNSLKDNNISELPPCSAVTPNEPVNSLIMGDEHLDTISATESDELIKSSVENLVPNPKILGDKIICDLDKTPDLSQRSPHNYPKCGHPILACYDDDDDDYAFAITPNEPVNSLSMRDEHLDTIPATKSDEFIKSSVEKPVPIPKSLLHNDSSIIPSSKIDSLFDEFAGELTLLKSISPRTDETDCDPEEETYFIKRLLYDNSSPHPPEEFIPENSDAGIESFSPSPIPVEDSDYLMEEIDLSFTLDYPMLPGIKDNDYDSERDILILKDLLSNGSLSLPKKESFHFDIPSFSRPPAKAPDGNTGILNVKMMGDIFEQKVPIPRLMITLIPNQEKSSDLLSHQGLETF
uniref:Reverse transcriptase domain-containing protein n=1 Tax=Tanacetum cinerariifolium TaxID=118510 RepID=A0A6L2JVI2_TANCI|nr:hypothetical protein [Tanacetum cinerariifolium]